MRRFDVFSAGSERSDGVAKHVDVSARLTDPIADLIEKLNPLIGPALSARIREHLTPCGGERTFTGPRLRTNRWRFPHKLAKLLHATTDATGVAVEDAFVEIDAQGRRPVARLEDARNETASAAAKRF